MLKEYKLSFNIYGLLLFLIIMIPNFIWFAVPAPNDVLRADSVTGGIDTIASVCQVLMIIAVMICCLLYFASWVGYYAGIVNMGVILGLTVSPCLAFLFFAIDRKNMIAVIPMLLILFR